MTDLDNLEKKVAALMREIDKEVAKAKHTYTFSHDDGEDGDGYGDDGDDYNDSNPSLDASNDDDDDGDIEKLGPGPRPRYPGDASHAGLHYPQDDLADALQSNDEDDRPGDLQTTDHATYRHHVQRAVDNISATENCPKEEALRRLRARHPAIANGSVPVAKRAATDFDSLVSREMKKGVNREIAGQRIAQQFGFRAFDNGSRITKRRGDLIYEFQKRVDEIMWKDQVDATEATRRARMEDPRLFAAMQRAG
jgi:hypothetical protein